MSRPVSSNALLFEDYDIKNMSKWFPDKEIGVNINWIYIQIARLSNNPNNQQEVSILSESLSFLENRKYLVEPKYIPMKICDVEKCFGKNLKILPNNAFISIDDTEEIKISANLG